MAAVTGGGRLSLAPVAFGWRLSATFGHDDDDDDDHDEVTLLFLFSHDASAHQ